MNAEGYAVGVRSLKLSKEHRIYGWFGAPALLSAAIAMILTGCAQQGGSKETRIETPEKPSGPVLTLDQATLGSITGTVKLDGNLKQITGIISPCSKGGSV